MKKLAIAMMLGIAAMSASAQVNYKMQVACSPQDVKTYDKIGRASCRERV